jgi:16S rRNA C1402 (ribose-2'-O) methylase RsmI
MPGHLILVPTPIGNLGDLTERAKKALKDADLVACGSFAKARELGKLRTEGKEYVVQDGDVMDFKTFV